MFLFTDPAIYTLVATQGKCFISLLYSLVELETLVLQVKRFCNSGCLAKQVRKLENHAKPNSKVVNQFKMNLSPEIHERQGNCTEYNQPIKHNIDRDIGLVHSSNVRLETQLSYLD